MVANILFMILTLISIFSGIKFGYFHSHTPPLPFVISSLLIVIGLFVIFFKKILFKNRTNFGLHLMIIGVNLVLVLFCLSPFLINMIFILLILSVVAGVLLGKFFGQKKNSLKIY